MTTPADLPEGALHILQHSLGVDQHGEGEQYRNRFVTGEGSVDYPVCVALVVVGLMTRRAGKGPPFGGMDFFFVTDAGKAFVAEHSPPAPKLSRSKQRYRRYLNADSSMPFGEWLRSPWADLRHRP
ncbi:hypothetical protein DAH66_12785 [Sphingomonas koreensis]|uniref:Uncharacterized protein n=1 Tax=Sphingomonas koreensis TaxID=93064 RepID=A0A430G2E9_9SPHN|nr:hypothetical protein [Sphingomonas koreensis]RSY83139.1 hypothetical protein DAH66_12785 [Sphingomonas koreensis]